MSFFSTQKATQRLRAYLIAGVLTVIPVWVTWLVFSFIFGQLSNIGMPWVRMLSAAIREDAPFLTRLLLAGWFQSALAVIVTLLVLYLLGWAATRVLGRRVILLFDSVMHRIPLVEKIYGGTKRLLVALEHKPSDVQRVVLIEFPALHMKTLGFVTRVLVDEGTGQKLAMVYVPTTPNPSSGYLEVVPVDRVTSTDLTVDEAMSMIVSGGFIGPETLPFSGRSMGELQAKQAPESVVRDA